MTRFPVKEMDTVVGWTDNIVETMYVYIYIYIHDYTCMCRPVSMAKHLMPSSLMNPDARGDSDERRDFGNVSSDSKLRTETATTMVSMIFSGRRMPTKYVCK